MQDGYHGIQLLGHGLERGRATNQLRIGSGALLSPREDSSGIMDAKILPAVGAGRNVRRDLDRWEMSVRGRRLHVPKLGEQAVEGGRCAHADRRATRHPIQHGLHHRDISRYSPENHRL